MRVFQLWKSNRPSLSYTYNSFAAGGKGKNDLHSQATTAQVTLLHRSSRRRPLRILQLTGRPPRQREKKKTLTHKASKPTRSPGALQWSEWSGGTGWAGLQKQLFLAGLVGKKCGGPLSFPALQRGVVQGTRLLACDV